MSKDPETTELSQSGMEIPIRLESSIVASEENKIIDTLYDL